MPCNREGGAVSNKHHPIIPASFLIPALHCHSRGGGNPDISPFEKGGHRGIYLDP